MSTTLTFAAFQQINRARCEEIFHEPGNEWPIQNWALAIAGESGELCNIIKKVLRGDFTLEIARTEILKEIADVICYCDLAMSCLGAETDEIVLAKFNEVSRRVGWDEVPIEPLRQGEGR